MVICDNGLLKRFLGDAISPVERTQLLKHLKGCDVCKSYLKSSGLDEYDVVMTILTEEGMAHDKSIDTPDYEANKEQNYQKIMERVSKSTDSKRRICRFGTFTSIPTYIAALLVIGFGVLLYRNVSLFAPHRLDKPYMQSKGLKDKKVPEIGLIFLAVTSKKGEITIKERGVNQGHYSRDKDILFRYTIKEDGFVYLLHANNKGVDLLFPFNEQTVVKRGTYDFADNGEILGYSLSQLTGEQYFFALYSRTPLDPVEDIVPVFKEGEWLVKDKVDVKILVSRIPDTTFDYVRVFVE